MNVPSSRQRRPGLHRFGVTLTLGLVLIARPLHADSTSASRPELELVVISSPDCGADSFPLMPFLASLRAELAGVGLRCCAVEEFGDPVASRASVGLTLELVLCASDADRSDADRVQLRAHGPAGAGMTEREVFLGDVADPARPRALALIAAELIRSMPSEPVHEAPPALPTPKEGALAASSPVRADDSARSLAFSLQVEAEARDYPVLDTHLWGGRLRLTVQHHPLYADIDAGASYVRTRVDLGELVLQSGSVGLGIGRRIVSATVILDLGVRAELGWAWIHGESRQADVRKAAGSDLYSSWGLRGSLQVPSQLKVRPGLALEGGGVVRSFNGEVNGRTVTGITGYYLLAALGLAISL